MSYGKKRHKELSRGLVKAPIPFIRLHSHDGGPTLTTSILSRTKEHTSFLLLFELCSVTLFSVPPSRANHLPMMFAYIKSLKQEISLLHEFVSTSQNYTRMELEYRGVQSPFNNWKSFCLMRIAIGIYEYHMWNQFAIGSSKEYTWLAFPLEINPGS